MSQDAISNTSTQETSLVGGNNTSTGFVTGATCTSSGTYKADNKYMTTVQLYAAGDIFRPGTDGKKVTWYPLTRTASSGFTSDGGFTSVKVEAGTV
jgi:hypothetical protein